MQFPLPKGLLESSHKIVAVDKWDECAPGLSNTLFPVKLAKDNQTLFIWPRDFPLRILTQISFGWERLGVGGVLSSDEWGLLNCSGFIFLSNYFTFLGPP